MALRRAALISVGLAGAEATGAMPIVSGKWTAIKTSSTVAGTVTISQRTSADKTQNVHVAVTGLTGTADCPAAADGDTTCGVLVYKGTCEAPLKSGNDAPKIVEKTSGGTKFILGQAGDGKTAVTVGAGTETVESGSKMSDLKSGHFVLVMSADDEELACAPLAEFAGGKDKAGTITLDQYNKKKTKGKAKVTWDGAKQVAQLEISADGDAGCVKTSTNCKMYISKAGKCEKSEEAKLKEMLSDKFQAQYIVADKKAKMSTHVMDMTAEDAKKIIGKTLVLTDNAGDVVSCGKIAKEGSGASGASSLVAGPMAGFLALVAALWTGA